MKLSKLSTEKTADVLCEIAPHITNIITDEELINELRSAVDFKNAKTYAEKIMLVATKISKFIPIILKRRKTELFSVLAAINDKTVEEIAKQNIITTMLQIKDVTKDKELLDFFKSCTGTEESE